MDTEELAKTVAEVGELLPNHMTIAQLASVIMTLTHAYIRPEDVPEFFDKLAEVSEKHMESTKSFVATKH
jgi:hypothetical protein